MDLIPEIQLYSVDSGHYLSNESAFMQWVGRNIPFTLPILGGILQQPDGSLQTEQRVYIWTTFQFGSPNIPPTLYSVILLFPLELKQACLFCSEETSPSPPSSVAESHVIGAIRAFMHIVDTKYNLKGTTDGASAFLFGSLHEKWVSCLQSYQLRTSPCVRYVCIPRPSEASPSILESNLMFSQIQDTDVDYILGKSHISRTPEYILSRASKSVCIRSAAHDVCESQPVAWVLLHADGSIGMLHVEPKLRRKGLAQLLTNQLLHKLQPTVGVIHSGGGALGWNWADVEEGNEGGKLFFNSLVGWKKERMCYWIPLKYPFPEVI